MLKLDIFIIAGSRFFIVLPQLNRYLLATDYEKGLFSIAGKQISTLKPNYFKKVFVGFYLPKVIIIQVQTGLEYSAG